MIKHIVMWKLDEGYSSEEKENILDSLKKQLLDLETKVDALRSISVGLNHIGANNTNFDIILDTSFDNMADLKAYAIHPEHMKVVGYLKSIKLDRACVDYEV